jgi:hypothetical protein
MKNKLNTYFQQKFATGSYGVRIGCAWCSQKACEICSSIVQKNKLKKNKILHTKLPKQQSTSFWSQRILGVENGFEVGINEQKKRRERSWKGRASLEGKFKVQNNVKKRKTKRKWEKVEEMSSNLN